MRRQFHRQFHNEGCRIARPPLARPPLDHLANPHAMVAIDEHPSSFGPGLLWRIREAMIHSRIAPCEDGNWILLCNGRRIVIPAPLWMKPGIQTATPAPPSSEREKENNVSNKYIGVKIVGAEPMTRAAYNEFRGWELPADENGADEGFLVEYMDGGKPNVEGRAGYVSWSPKEQFENAYRPTTGMTFGLAIEALKLGKKVARAGWNGKGMWLSLVLSIHDIPRSGTTLPVYRLTMHDTGATALPWIGMKTADNKFVPWLASQTDMLAEDWQVVDQTPLDPPDCQGCAPDCGSQDQK